MIHTTNDKNTHLLTAKNTPFGRKYTIAANRIIANKVKDELISQNNNSIAVLQRSYATAQRRTIALTIRLEATGSWQPGGIMVLVFFDVLLVLLVVCVEQGARAKLKYDPPPPPPPPQNVGERMPE